MFDCFGVPICTDLMHELFLTTSIGDEFVAKATRILQGYCAMSPVPLLRRRLILKGPSNRKDIKPLDSAFILNVLSQNQMRGALWRTLNEQFMRQSYILTLIYDIKRDEFPQPGVDQTLEENKILDCDDIPGALQWYELPEPGVKLVNSRPAISIDGEKKLVSLLQSVNYKFSSELIEEGYQFVHGNVVIYLTRYLTIPPEAQAKEANGKLALNRSMPRFEDLTPIDGDNKWVIMTKLEVSNGNDPELTQRGTEELLAVKTDFMDLFDLQPRDRLIFDTRVKHY